MKTKELQIRTLSSLAKVFPQRIVGNSHTRVDGVCGTEVSFQVALRMVAPRYRQDDYEIKVISELSERIKLYKVGLVPSALPVYPHSLDENYITSSPQLFPDPLLPIENFTFRAAAYNWRSIWVTVNIGEDIEAKEYPITLEFYRKGELKGRARFNISVHGVRLPESDFIYTDWFHCDCIADVHGVKIFSEEHWSLIESYMRLASKHGMNMILTPILTPALDTAVGAERPTVQLVGVEKTGDEYNFDFSLLKRFVDTAKRCGIERFEISHFFTQWGAEFTPKVVAQVDGRSKKIFGWHVSSLSPEYAEFLRALVPQLISFLESCGTPRENIYFHVSDEPNEVHLERYHKVSALLYPLIEGCKHIDALSSLSFYKQGLVNTPVVATDHIKPYLDDGISELWCYYCCSQGKKVSNRFLAMPSHRTRIIGVQMYKYGIKGFLHWGYNFYYTQFSKRLVDPIREADAVEAFQSGDAFVVYPYGDGVISSLRQKVFADALNDMRFLSLLEAKIGKEQVVAELDRLMGEDITFESCPESERFFDELYKMIFSYLES